jgi:hypothetical protein
MAGKASRPVRLPPSGSRVHFIQNKALGMFKVDEIGFGNLLGKARFRDLPGKSMEHQIVLASAIALAALCAGWLFLRLIKSPPFASTSTVAGACLIGVFLIGVGLFNLFFGFRDGEMYSIWPHVAHRGWFAYADYKAAFAFVGTFSSFCIFFGGVMIKVLVFNSIKLG